MITLGYVSSYFIVNTSSLIPVMFYYAIFALFIVLTQNVQHPMIKEWRTKLKDQMVWNDILQFGN